MSKQKVVLPADVFDALELSALIHGGIGTSCLSKEKPIGFADAFGDREYVETPSCIIGHALFLDGYEYHENQIIPGDSPVRDALVGAFPALNDDIAEAKTFGYQDVVCAIESENDSKVSTYAVNRESTLTWKQWAKRMRVVRGES